MPDSNPGQWASFYPHFFGIRRNIRIVSSSFLFRSVIAKSSETPGHRRRIETEGKAKVVTSVWGAQFVQFLAALAVLPQSIWKKRLNSAGLFGRNGSIQPVFLNLIFLQMFYAVLNLF